MSTFVCNGAKLQCSFGTLLGSLLIVNPKRPTICNQPLANVNDIQPFVNIASFGMCTSLANPATTPVAPGPCIPVTSAPWSPGARIYKVADIAAVTTDCKCQCAYGGSISILSPGHTSTVTVD